MLLDKPPQLLVVRLQHCLSAMRKDPLVKTGGGGGNRENNPPTPPDPLFATYFWKLGLYLLVLVGIDIMRCKMWIFGVGVRRLYLGVSIKPVDFSFGDVEVPLISGELVCTFKYHHVSEKFTVSSAQMVLLMFEPKRTPGCFSRAV